MKQKLSVFAALILGAALIIYSQQALESARYALGLCAQMIVPSLFPFFVVSMLLSRLGLPGYLGRALAKPASRLFGVSGAGASAFIMGLCGGYPLGAAYIADMVKEGSVSPEEGGRLLGFCNNSGPAFIIGVIGTGVFSSSGIGLYLYGVHILSAALCGMLLKGRSEPSEYTPVHIESMSLGEAVPQAVKQAVGSVLSVCGFVAAFTVLVSLLDANGIVEKISAALASVTAMDCAWYTGLITGIFELGSGAAAMRGLDTQPINLALAAFILGFGGISVHFQTAAVTSGANIKGSLHFAGRLITASISAVLAYIGALLFF